MFPTSRGGGESILMQYDIPMRYLARMFLSERVSITRKAIFSRIGDILNVDDLNVASVSSIDIHNGRVHPATQVTDGRWSVVAQPESVDVEFRPNLAVPGPTFQEFTGSACAILGHVLRVSGLRATRLASAQEGMLEQSSPEVMLTTVQRLMRLPAHAEAPSEWDYRCVWRRELRFGSHTEMCNTILTIKRVQGELTAVRKGETEAEITRSAIDRIRVELDINTLPQAIDRRFSDGDLESFLSESVVWHEDLSKTAMTLLREQT